MTALHRFARRIAGDRRGLALVEFAFVVPVLILLFVGGYQLSDGIFASRKVSRTVRTVADLTSQYTKIDDATLDTILAASQQIMTPYKIDSTEIRVSQITTNGNGAAKVDWSRGKNVSALPIGNTAVIPNQYLQKNTTIIFTEATYHYVPSFASGIIGPIDIKDQMVMYPRKSTNITKV